MLKNKKILIAIFSIIIFEMFIYIIEPIIAENIKIITLVTIIFLVTVYFIWLKIRKEKCDIKYLIYLVIIIGILLRTMYIIYTPITERQHDVYGIKNNGHLGYIYTIYETGELPKTNNVQFYHPPLFHSISAGWLKVNEIFNVPLEKSLEGIQVITAIFSSIILIVTYKITDKLEIKGYYKLLINTFMSFYPTFIILAGSINNDVLTILLQFCIILYLIKWDKDNSIKNTVILAILTGFCVMTKISGAIMSVPILFVFIKKISYILKNDKKKLSILILKFVIFGIISLPLGLWHPIRNYILFKQPIGGVLLPSNMLYIGNYTETQRFFTISIKQLFGEIYCTIPGDYNLFAFIVKSSIFGEFSYKNLTIIAIIMKALNLFLISLSIIFTVVFIVRKSRNTFIEDLLLIIWITNIISFYSFNIEYPYLCTMDFRYIVPTAFIGIVILLSVLSSINSKIIKKLVENTICLFISMCFIMFFII